MPCPCSMHALQMKGWWESNINVWFPCMYSIPRNETVLKQNYNVLSPSSYTHISVRDLYISRIGLPILLQEIFGLILGKYISPKDTWMWKLALRPRNSQKRNCVATVPISTFTTFMCMWAIPQSRFPQSPHSCVCERLIYSHNRSAYSAAGNMWTEPGNI